MKIEVAKVLFCSYPSGTSGAQERKTPDHLLMLHSTSKTDLRQQCEERFEQIPHKF